MLYFLTFFASLVPYCETLLVYLVMFKHNKNVSVSQSITLREKLCLGYFWLLISKILYHRVRKNIIVTLNSLSELQYFMKLKGLNTYEWQLNLLDIVYEIWLLRNSMFPTFL